ncbi:hypothetical protein Glove_227g81 [Diversispora epigaea]|uniref:GPI ethanolamine phosphate transferase 1 n=1 Tax=Diversispora epigaea TaxID=1348612 RepID=A0A397IE35_9GLOM|nr:hypothetical protein Glove_227g81 [Diversispora epigaea]
MTQYKVDIQPPAKRLFLFVGDGLRADKLYQLYQDENDKEKLITLAPFLRDIIQNHGTWGISHTRVPTESRPGHVAIIAGFYEDVSAVTKGWKTNPVEFDSVFNQSRYTWSFGSPDILPMFAEGASDPDRVKTIMYSSESENFAEDASKLDTWVFEQFTQLLANSTTDLNLYNKLNDDQIVIFLHLLGLDSNGHAYGPHSKEYLNNIKVVDEGINKIVKIIEDFYGNDEKTAYIFTADHGMSNRGNHGDGHPDNTRTPIIAWGAGINKPNRLNPIGHDEFSKEWELDNIQRNDILQADIAPLMASLIGINYPVNSVGELPLGYLKNTPIFKAQSAFINAKEILEQYKVKYEYKKKTKLWFKEFPGMSNSTHNPEVIIQKIQNLINAEQYEEAETICVMLIKLSLEGLRYFQTYDWLMLRSIVTAGYLGWILYSLKFTLKEYAFEEKFIEKKVDSINVYINIITAISLILSIGLLYVQKSPGTYYTYVIFPVYFWREILLDKNIFFDAYKNSLNHKNSFLLLFYIIGYILVLEVFVYSYFERSVLSFCFGLLAFWPLFISSEIRSQNVFLFISWFISCFASSVFTLLPVEKGEDITLLIIGGLLITITGIIALWKSSNLNFEQNSRKIIGFQIILIIISLITVYDTTNKLKEKTGLPFLNQIIAWMILVISTVTPFVFGFGFNVPQHHLQRLTIITLAFSPSLNSLHSNNNNNNNNNNSSSSSSNSSNSSNKNNVKNSSSKTRKLEILDCRISLIFLFFIKVAFFGTGNVASLASFSLQSVYRLTTIFDPFLMGGLLLFKISIPFFIVSSVFGVINKSLNLPSISLFLLVLSTCDIMTLNFFYLVRDYGSCSSSSSNSSNSSNKNNVKNSSSKTRKLEILDCRISLIFLFFIKVAFFGTGNVASLASFSLQSVYRLTTIFDPFLMGGLLLFKISIPFFIVSSVFGVINKSLNLPSISLFLLVLSTCDIMTLNFFYLVRDYGSWLEIGTTISHFVISSLFSLFLILLFLFSEFSVGRVIIDGNERKVK